MSWWRLIGWHDDISWPSPFGYQVGSVSMLTWWSIVVVCSTKTWSVNPTVAGGIGWIFVLQKKTEHFLWFTEEKTGMLYLLLWKMHPGASRLSFVGLMEPEGFDKDKPVALDWEYDAMRHWDCNLGERHRCFWKDAYQVKVVEQRQGPFEIGNCCLFFLLRWSMLDPLVFHGPGLVGKTFQFMDNLGCITLGIKKPLEIWANGGGCPGWNQKTSEKDRVFGFGFSTRLEWKDLPWK